MKKIVQWLLVLMVASIPRFLFAQQPDSTATVMPASTSTVVIDSTMKVSGTILDAATGLPLPGINVSVPDYASAITNDNGNFSIPVNSYAATLLVSGEGYQAKQIAVKGRSEINVRLFEESFRSVYDVATLPGGVKAANQVVQSVNSVNTQDRWTTFSETPENYFQGKIPGLNVIRRSGAPGIGANLFLRGLSSLYATHQPLVIVDGMIYDMNDYGGSLINGNFSNPMSHIDIKDIDNVTVIKDAVSTYGSKAANGVILITTNHAKELTTKIDFVMSGGVNFSPKALPVLGAGDYRVLLTDMLKSRGDSPESIQALPYLNDDVNNPAYYRYHNNTNWQDKVFKGSSNQNYYLKVTGGDNIAKYALSLGYLKQGGIVSNTDFSRYNTRFNADLNMSPKFTVNTNLSFSLNEQNLVDQGVARNTNPVYISLIKSPLFSTNEISDAGIASPNLADVDILNVSNPVALVNTQQATNRNYRFFGSVKATYALAKHLTISSLFGLTFDKVRENTFNPRRGTVADTLENAIAESEMASSVQRLFALNNDTRISYNRTFNRIHGFSAQVGVRYMYSNSEVDFGKGYNSATDDLQTVGTGVSTLRQAGGEIGQWRWLNYFASTDYQLLNKYFLSLAVGVDGSSRFGKEAEKAITLFDNKFGVFPSVAASWLISSESFMANLNAIELLKLRVSYGLTGNDDIGNYNSRQYYVSQNLLGMQGLVRGNISNPKLRWETNQKVNAGVDLALLNERISFSIDLFHNTTRNMLAYESTTTAAGIGTYITNNGSMENQGMELGVNSRILNQAVKWDVGLNIATYKNKITSVPNGEFTTSFAGATILTRQGGAANLFLGYHTNGVYSSDEEAASYGYSIRTASGSLVPFKGGDVRFIDRNGDQVIDETDRTIIGNPNPDFTGMVSSRLAWKRFSLDVAFTFSYGNDIYNYTRAQLESMQGTENQTLKVLNRWRANGQVTNTPRASWGDPMGNARFSDRWIEDGSYLRLRALTLNYDIPFTSGFLKYAAVYATANNLFTMTKYLGYDPEFSAAESIFGQGIDVGMIPQYRSVQVGVRIGL